MSHHLLFVITILLTACSVSNSKKNYTSIDSAYTSEYACLQYGRVKIYRHLGSEKKLNGSYQTRRSFQLSDSVTTVFKTTCQYRRGLRNGIEHWYVDDSIRRISRYKKGLREGESLEFWKSKQTKSHYKHGIKDGLEEEFMGSRLIRSVYFKHGIKSGEEIYFDSSGIKSSSSSFQMDSIFPSRLMRYAHRLIETPYAIRDSMLLQDFRTYYEFKGTIHISAYQDNDGCCLPLVRSTIDDSKIRSLWECDFPRRAGFYYIIEYSLAHLDMIESSFYLVYSDKYSPASFQYLEILRNGNFLF
ncbi:MAG: hypothetical protein EP338_07320 [Bacteroidetes bacterium]|nr:MAG: hypothetical protein EP338_07320 [Bacteroidota bacterium]